MIEKLRILIIDDTKFVRDKLKEILDTHYIVDIAASKDDALKKLQIAHKQLFKYDLILLDNYLPGPDEGIEILQFVIEEQIDTIALMVSGHTEIESEPFKTAIKAFQTGAVDFLTKPFPKNDLLDRIAQLISKKKQALAFLEIAGHMQVAQYKEQLESLLGDNEIDMLTKKRIKQLLTGEVQETKPGSNGEAFLEVVKNIEINDNPTKNHASMWNKRIRSLQDIPEKPRHDIFRVLASHKQIYKIRFGSLGTGGSRTDYKIKIRPPVEGSGQLFCSLYGPSPINCTRQNFIIFVDNGAEEKVKRDIEQKIPAFCLN
jgi:CheY-like chemotaxis protein